MASAMRSRMSSSTIEGMAAPNDGLLAVIALASVITRPTQC